MINRTTAPPQLSSASSSAAQSPAPTSRAVMDRATDSIRAAARKYGAPYYRTRGRRQGRHSLRQNSGHRITRRRASGKSSEEESAKSCKCHIRGARTSHHSSALGAIVSTGSGSAQAAEEESPDEPSTKDMLREIIKRLDTHESTTLARIDSVYEDLTRKMTAHESAHTSLQQANHELLLREVSRLEPRILDSSFSSQVPHGGPQFQTLPPEIRYMIWELATPGKILEIRGREDIESHKYRAPGRFVGNRSPPVTAQICRESRAVACRSGRLMSLERFTPGSANGSGPEGSRVPWGPKQWAWFDSYRDSLYIRYLQDEYVINKLNLRYVCHLILPRRECERNILQILREDACPNLKSIEIVCASIEWPMKMDMAFETSIWGNDYHKSIQLKKGDFAEATRLCDLLELQGPQNDYFNHFSRFLHVVAAKDRWDGDQSKAYPERIIRYWSEREDLRWIDRPVETLRDMAERSMIRCIWMLSKITYD
ncbi:hypothetical protein F5Y14DRAFT_463898 [Nemania sp. NC0429]|nr:hypothetical protein F5Y14DRAFT_463898 [Nemania sp. NC0429]